MPGDQVSAVLATAAALSAVVLANKSLASAISISRSRRQHAPFRAGGGAGSEPPISNIAPAVGARLAAAAVATSRGSATPSSSAPSSQPGVHVEITQPIAYPPQLSLLEQLPLELLDIICSRMELKDWVRASGACKTLFNLQPRRIYLPTDVHPDSCLSWLLHHLGAVEELMLHDLTRRTWRAVLPKLRRHNVAGRLRCIFVGNDLIGETSGFGRTPEAYLVYRLAPHHMRGVGGVLTGPLSHMGLCEAVMESGSITHSYMYIAPRATSQAVAGLNAQLASRLSRHRGKIRHASLNVANLADGAQISTVLRSCGAVLSVTLMGRWQTLETVDAHERPFALPFSVQQVNFITLQPDIHIQQDMLRWLPVCDSMHILRCRGNLAVHVGPCLLPAQLHVQVHDGSLSIEGRDAMSTVMALKHLAKLTLFARQGISTNTPASSVLQRLGLTNSHAATDKSGRLIKVVWERR